MLKKHSNKFQHYFEMSWQIWTEVPQANTKATPVTSDDEKEIWLCQMTSLLDSHWVEESVVFDKCTMQ